MAIADQKKLDDENVRGLARPATAGSTVGNLTLIPGSGADAAVKALAGFKERYNAAPTGPKIISPDNPLSMETFTPPAPRAAQPAGAAPGASLSPISTASAAPRAAASAPGLNLIEPSNAASLALTPPSAGVSARPPAAPASAGAGNVAGTFNGREITRGEADAIAARVPTAAAGAPVIAGPNGGFAFTPPGGVGAAPGSLASAASAVPSFSAPSVDTSRVRDAETERAAVAKAIDDRIAALSFGPDGLNSRGKRQLYADLVGQRAGLAKQAGDLAGASETSQRQSGTALTTTAAQEAGANQRATEAQAGETARATAADAAANIRAGIQRPEYVTDKDGNVNLATGSTFAPVTDAKGNTLRAPSTRAEGAITPAVQLDALVKQLQAEQGAIQPDATRITNLQQQIAGLTSGAAPAQGQTATNPQTGQRVRLNPATNQWEPIQ